MCIGIPMQVIECSDTTARCDNRGAIETVDMSLVGEQPEGSWVLVFLGAAREILTEQRAVEISQAVQALESVMSGNAAASSQIDSFFADLVDREPQLPEHLRQPD